ncbi:hypothetical protein RV18_GL002258 [Enterococcus termitis]|nr:hypothetical protein RV18_GL002258 [Enterococcus termitis]
MEKDIGQVIVIDHFSVISHQIQKISFHLENGKQFLSK